MRAALLIPALTCSSLASSQVGSLIIDEVLTKDAAYVVHSSTLAIGQEVVSFFPSPNGECVIALVREPIRTSNDAPSYAIVIWGDRGARSFRFPIDEPSYQDQFEVKWFSNSLVAIVVVPKWTQFTMSDNAGKEETFFRNDADYYCLNVLSKTISRLQDSVDWFDRRTKISLSPNHPIGVVVSSISVVPGPAEYQLVFRSILPNGQIGVARTSSVEVSGFEGVKWRTKDSRAYIQASMLTDEGPPAKGLFSFDPFSSMLTTIPPLNDEEATPTPDLVLQSRGIIEPLSGKRTLNWFLVAGERTEDPDALVTEHADFAKISTDLRCVYFLYKGALFASNIEKISLSDYQARQEEKAMRESLMNARECGLALLMYAADNDDVFGPEFKFPHDIDVYVKDLDILTGFVFTFSGGRLSAVENPTETELGYIETRYGRAVVYVDGHSEWKKPD